MSNYPVTVPEQQGDAAERRKPLEGEILTGGASPRPGGVAGDPTLALLDLISFVMDRLVPIPGTRLRVGLNSLVLLLPVFGDVLASLVSVGILAIGLSSYRVPRIVAARMVLNTLLDTSLGWIPVVGDLFDLFFKADTRNVRLLQQYLAAGPQQQPSTWRHWVFVVTLLGGFIAVLVLIVLGIVALVHRIVEAVQGR